MFCWEIKLLLSLHTFDSWVRAPESSADSPGQKIISQHRKSAVHFVSYVCTTAQYWKSIMPHRIRLFLAGNNASQQKNMQIAC